MPDKNERAKAMSQEKVSVTCFDVSYECETAAGEQLEGGFYTKSATGLDKKVRAYAGDQVTKLSFACIQKTFELPLDEFVEAAGCDAIEPDSVEDVG